MGNEVAFKKKYLGETVFNIYQGTVDENYTTISGLWRMYDDLNVRSVYNGITNPAEGRDVYSDTFILYI